MAFIVKNVERFFADRIGQSDLSAEKDSAIDLAKKLAYLGKISGADIPRIMGSLSDAFIESLQEPGQIEIFFKAEAEFEKQAAKLREFESRLNRLLIENGFREHVPKKTRGFEILSAGRDMPLYNYVAGLAGEEVKDLGLVIMSIGFGDVDHERREGDKYVELLRAHGIECQIFKMPDYPKSTGAVYVYVKA